MYLKEWVKISRGVILRYDTGIIEFTVCTSNIIRVRYNTGDYFNEEETFVVENIPSEDGFEINQIEHNILEISTNEINVHISMMPFYFTINDSKGVEIVASSKDTTFGTRDNLKISHFILKNDERIYGLGQDPMAYLDQRDRQRSMWQEWGGMRRCGNVGIPFYLSTSGYGFLLNSSWAARFSIGRGELPDDSVGSDSTPTPWNRHELSGENDPEKIAVLLNGGDMDLFLIYGPSFDRIHEGYAELVGHAPMLPIWVFGFMQSNNNYRTQEEFLKIGADFREKGIPCDVLVKDWLWFKEFGDFCWSKDSFTDPSDMLKELGKQGFHVLLSQQPYVDRESINYESFKQAGYLLRLTNEEHRRPIFDHTNPEARKAWWGYFEKIYNQGVRGYWTDMGEPENHMPGDISYMGCREKVHNIYSLLWNKGLYEGQRSISDERVFILPRTNYPGIQRYGSVLWSGDVDASWEVLHDQVVIGQGVCLSGQQYWTSDIGGFLTNERLDPELYARWFEWGAFCPIFRTHGTRPENEPWSYGDEVEAICRRYLDLRYRLLPYIYSCSRMVTETGRVFMRAMCMDYADDPIAVEQTHQYMFGPAILVAPVTEKGCRVKKIYLPCGDWYDFWSSEKYSGGTWIEVAAPLGRIPLFVKAGSIIPMLPEDRRIKHTGEYNIENLELRVFAGNDGAFELYNDNGLTYAYEKGEYEKLSFEYSNKGKILSIGYNQGINAQESYSDLKSIDVKVYGAENIQIIDAKTDKTEAVTARRSLTMVSADTTIEDIISIDACLDTSGILCVHAATSQNCGNIKNAHLIPPYGWKIISFDNKSSASTIHLIWKLIPDSLSLPLVNEGSVVITCENRDGCIEKIERLIKWGSGYATRWSIISFSANGNPRAIDMPAEVEMRPEQPSYEVEGRKVYWQRLSSYDFNCMGYVDLRPAGFYFSGILFGDMDQISYAKCKVWCDTEQNVYMDVAAEPCIRVNVNSAEVLSSDRVVLEEIVPTPVCLKKGWNSVLIKVAAVEKNCAFTGRVFGFKFRFVDKDGNVLKDLLYMP